MGEPSKSPAPEEAEAGPFAETPRGSSWRPHLTLPVFSRYGRFELLGRLARGGMAEILLARERALGDAYRYVVVKRILPQSAEDDEYVKMFLGEGRLMMGLSHPNICHVYDVGQDGPTWFIAMEWVHGESLMKLIRRAKNRGVCVPPALAARVVADVASALHGAHTAKDASGRPLGIVHRDVSPHNVMITYEGAVKLLDFGIAKVTSSSDHTTTGIVKGKFAYMAPEQCLGRPLDARADVFALGVCLFETLTGRSLYRRGNDYDTLHAVIKEPVPSVREIDERIPEALDRIVQKALQKDRNDRWQSAQEMQLALEKYLADERQVVSSALVRKMVRRLFAEEILAGPTLEPLGSALPVAPEDPSVVVSELLEDEISEVRTTPPPPEPSRRYLSVLALLALAALVAAAAHVTAERGIPRVDAPASDATVTAAAVDTDTVTDSDARTDTDTDSDARTDTDTAAEPESTRDSVAEHADPEPPPPDRPRAREPTATATLSLNTHPWSKVYLRGRLLGTTPLGAARVPAGRLRLRFEDRDGRIHNRTLYLAAGEAHERFIELGAE